MVARKDPATSARRGWLAGLVVGGAAGFASLELGFFGWAIAAAFAVPALIVGPRLASISGLLSGSGVIWLALLGRVALTCRVIDNDNGCRAPGIEFWLAAGAAQLVIGVALGVASLILNDRRSGQRET